MRHINNIITNAIFRQALACACAVIASLGTVSYSYAQDSFTTAKSNVLWLSDDVNLSTFDDNQYDSFLGKGEYWGNKWGVSAELQQSDETSVFGFPEDSQFYNLDVKRRFGSRDKSNVELGLGWQELNIDSYLDASGPRLSVAGRLNVNVFSSSFQVYGLTSYFPELEDDFQDNDASAYEVEAGLLYAPTDSVSLRAGYRRFSLDLDDSSIEDIGSSSGFLLGTDWSW